MKTKKKVSTLLTADEAITTVHEYADATSRLKKIEGQMEIEIAKVRDKFKDEIATHRDVIKDTTEKLQYYAEFNKEKIFGEVRSIDLQFGIIGFRIGMPKLDKLRGLSWEDACVKLKKINEDLVRVKEEVDKEAIIAMRDDKKFMEKLNGIGIQVIQDETFFVKSKEEELIEA